MSWVPTDRGAAKFADFPTNNDVKINDVIMSMHSFLEVLQHVQGEPKVTPKFVERAKETKSWDMDTEIITAINEIRKKIGKGHIAARLAQNVEKRNLLAHQVRLTMH